MIHIEITSCILTGRSVRNYDNSSGIIDGYSYIVKINDKERLIKLTSTFKDPRNQKELKKFSKNLIELLDIHNQWSFFDTGRSLNALKEKYESLKNLPLTSY